MVIGWPEAKITFEHTDIFLLIHLPYRDGESSTNFAGAFSSPLPWAGEELGMREIAKTVLVQRPSSPPFSRPREKGVKPGPVFWVILG